MNLSYMNPSFIQVPKVKQNKKGTNWRMNVTIKECSKILGIEESELKEMIDNDLIFSHRMNGKNYIKRDYLNYFKRKNKL